MRLVFDGRLLLVLTTPDPMIFGGLQIFDQGTWPRLKSRHMNGHYAPIIGEDLLVMVPLSIPRYPTPWKDRAAIPFPWSP